MNRTASVLLKSLGLVVVYFAHGLSVVSGQAQTAVDASPSRTPRGGSRVNLASIVRSSTPHAVSPASPQGTVPHGAADRAVEEETALVTEVEVASVSAKESASSRVALVESSRDDGAGEASSSHTPRAIETANVERVESSGSSSPAEELRRRAERQPPSQGMRGSHFVEGWEIPEIWAPGTTEVEWPEWVFTGSNLYIDEPPDYAEIAPLPLFYVQPPRETELKRKMKKLVRNKLFREVRRHTKRRWRKIFKADTTMRFGTYEETLAKINHIGKDTDQVDEFNDEFRTNETKDQIFRREERRGEPDIPLFTWGPLTLTAEGEIRFDMGTAAASDGEEVVVEKVEVGGKKAKPLFSGRDYKLHTSVRLSLNDDFTGGRNYLPFLSTYGVEVEVEWLSDILGREMVAAELEVEFDDDGDIAGFVNFVIKSRS